MTYFYNTLIWGVEKTLLGRGEILKTESKVPKKGV